MMPSTAIPDLWPEQIAETTEASPVSILNEQAARLSDKTQGLVEGEVSTAAIPPVSPLYRGSSFIYKSSIGEAHEIPQAIAPEGPTLVHSFYVKAPALDNYRFLLLTVLHGRKLYPLALSYMITNEKVAAGSKDEFFQRLGQFLSRAETIDLIQTLREQARTVKASEKLEDEE